MLYVFLTVIIIAVILFVTSFFFNDKLQSVEEQLEQFSIATMQDTYQLKNKIKVLEEELLTNEAIASTVTNNDSPKKFENNPLLVQKVQHLHEQGYSLDDISKETELNNDDVQAILNYQK